MKKALITFVKAPVPGTVKTRLQADLGKDKTLDVYKSFVREILSLCSRLKNVDRFLGCSPSKSHPFLKEMAKKHELQMFIQKGDSLGERIHHAFQHCARRGYSEIVLIGSDSPSIPLDFIKRAFRELATKDFVMGPCFDEGLYLIGARKDSIKKIFKLIEIDTGKDVSNILNRFSDSVIRISLLPFWYDIDTIHDLRLLKLHLSYLQRNIPGLT